MENSPIYETFSCYPPLNKDIGIEKERVTTTLLSLRNIETTVYWIIIKPKIIKNNGELTYI